MRKLKGFLVTGLGLAMGLLSQVASAGYFTNLFIDPDSKVCVIPQDGVSTSCSVSFNWSTYFEGETQDGTAGSYRELKVGGTIVGSGSSGSYTANITPGTTNYILEFSEDPNHSGVITTTYADYTPLFSHSTATHNTVTGDFNGNGEQDNYYQPKTKGAVGGLMPVVSNDFLDASFHRSWTTTHPQISVIEDWSEESYGAFKGNFNSNPGDELLLLGNKTIILLHGDIITPITIFPTVNNAIVSWNSSGAASHTAFNFDANPADFVIHIGDLSGDGFDEIFLQGKSKGSSSYILSNTGSLVQTLTSGFLNMEWSATSYTAQILNGDIVFTALSANDDDNIAYTNTSGAVTSLANTITKPTISGTSPKYLFQDVPYSLTPSTTSSTGSLTFSVSGQPAWMTLNTSTGNLSGTPAAIDTNKTHSITLTVKENKTHTISASMTFNIEVVETFQVSQTGYSVYQGTDGTLYLVSDNGVDVYKIVDESGVNLILKSSLTEFNGVSTTLLFGYGVSFVDVNDDGYLDMILEAPEGSGLDDIIVMNIEGIVHEVVRENIERDIGSLTMAVTEVKDADIVSNDRPVTSDVVGTLSSSANVSNGTVSYSVPIKVPPGRRGVQPEISLNYKSSSGNGIAGAGWQLAAKSAITRCSANWTIDGYTGRVDMENDDRLCLDGRKLVAISGAYGMNGTEYRTRDDSFKKVLQMGGDFDVISSYFKVIDKSGTVTYYGKTNNATLAPSGLFIPHEWAISSVWDNIVTQNSMDYSYLNSAGELLLSDIYYTGIAEEAGNRQVHFEYESRNDQSFKYTAGGSLNNTKRLSEVVSSVDNVDVNKYSLTYKTDNSAVTNRSTLESITQCGFENLGDGSFAEKCLPKREFSYSGQVQSFEQVESTNNIFSDDVTWRIANQLLGDYNNDGTLDFVRTKYLLLMRFVNNQLELDKAIELPFIGEPNTDPDERVKLGQLDFDGDGQLDILGLTNAGLTVASLNATQDGFIEYPLGIPMACSVKSLELQTSSGLVTYGLDYKHRNVCRADVIPDGAGGYYLFHRSSFQELYLSRIHHSCTGYVCSTQLVPGIDTTADFSSTYSTYEFYPLDYQLSDFDGDGDPDVLQLEQQGENVKLTVIKNNETGSGSNATSTFVSSEISLPVSKTWALAGGGSHWLDANGDGLKDLLMFSETWKLFLNNGGEFATAIDTGIEALVSSTSYTAFNFPLRADYTTHPSIRIVDFNGDGLDDFMFLDREVRKRDCFGDRRRSFCKEGTGGEAAGPSDFSISALAHGKYSVYLSSVTSAGSVDFELKQTDIQGTISYFYPIDLNSDGLLDFIGARWFHDYTIDDISQTSNPTKIFFHFGKIDNESVISDLLLSAADEQSPTVKSFGVKDEFEYKSFIQHRIEKQGSFQMDNSDLGSNDYFRIPSTQMVAIKHHVNNVLESQNTIEYVYGDPVYHQAGLGFLGFESISEINSAAGTTSEALYRMDYPLNGRMSNLTVKSTANKNILNSKTLSWCDTTFNGCDGSNTGLYFTHLEEQYSEYFDVLGNALKQERQVFSGYDDYGNITGLTTTLSDSTTTHVTALSNQFLPADESNWWVDKLDKSIITKSVSYIDLRNVQLSAIDEKVVTRNITWKAGNARQMESEKITANDTELEKTITYHSYDSFGNLTKVEQGGNEILDVEYTNVQDSLINEFEYSEFDGYFVNSEKNGLWLSNAVSRTWDIYHGAPKTETFANGLQVTNTYDSFGRLVSNDSNNAPVNNIVFEWCDDNCEPNAIYKNTSVQDGQATVVEEFNRGNQLLKRTIESFESNPSKIEEIFEYDRLGRLVNQQLPSYHGTTGGSIEYLDYDILGRPGRKVTSNAPQNFSVSYAYSGVNTDITVDAGMDGILAMARQYNFLDQLISSTDANGKQTHMRYDANGNAVLIEDVVGNDIHAIYDGFGNKLSFDDPNNGKWQFRYNALGQLRWQKDAKLVETRFDYDGLGRTTKNYVNNVIESTWVYDTRSTGALTSESRDNLQKDYYYDAVGRVVTESSSITHDSNNKLFDFNYAYDTYYGRVKGLRYPTGEILSYQYDKYGFLSKNLDPNKNDEVLRQIYAMSAQGKISSQQYLNGLYDTKIFAVSGETQLVCVQETISCGSSGTVAQIHYDDYDNFGNLKNKRDLVNSVSEKYVYDSFQRIKSATRSYSGVNVPLFNPLASVLYDYDDLGNLLYKTDYATGYTYAGGSSGGPNAVKSVTKLDNSLVNFDYDANGNMVSGDGISLTYDSFNKPITIIRNQVTSSFEYGADQQRYLQVLENGLKTTTTYYVDKRYEEVVTDNNGQISTEKRHYLDDFAVLTHKVDKKSLKYIHRDRLGSVHLVTEGYGNVSSWVNADELVKERRSFDVFGKPRDGLWGDSNDGKLISAISPRGFTDHEHLDDVALIHMNGRAYDYNLGRFLSVDPFIQLPENSQSINAYSYLMNNPLSGTDPTGYLGSTILDQFFDDMFNNIQDQLPDSILEKRQIEDIDKGQGVGSISTSTNGYSNSVGGFVNAVVDAFSEYGTEIITGDVPGAGPGGLKGATEDPLLGGLADFYGAGEAANTITNVSNGNVSGALQSGAMIFAGKVKAVKKAAAKIEEQVTALRQGIDVRVNSVEEAREILNNMPELRPGPGGNVMPGLRDRKNTYRGDLINKQDPLSPNIHPRGKHKNQPHYNIELIDESGKRQKPAIFIDTQ